MKRVSIGFVGVVCLVISSAPGQVAQKPEKEPRFTLLLHLNALDPETPEDISLKVGDLVVLSAERKQEMGKGDMAAVGKDRMAYTIGGEALEELTPIQPATPFRLQSNPRASAFVLLGLIDAPPQPLLRAAKPGEATLSVTVSHVGNWKETRVFKLMVTEERQPYQKVYGGPR